MAEVQSLRAHLVTELRDLLDAEHQLTRALPGLANQATTPALRVALEQHLQETERQIGRLTQAFAALGENPDAKRCEGMQGLLREGNTVIAATPAGALRDAVMIAAAQKVEHYEIASYGTARTYAQLLGHPQVANLLEATLNEEKNADLKLTQIAEGKVNENAAAEWHEMQGGIVEKTAVLAAKAFAAGTRSMERVADAVGFARTQATSGSAAALTNQVSSAMNRAVEGTTETADNVTKAVRRQVRRVAAGNNERSRKRAAARPAAKRRTRTTKKNVRKRR